MISTPPDCSSSFNPYAYEPSALHACGLDTTALSGTTPLPDGGARYDFGAGGPAVTHLYSPPNGFNPQTASDEQLAEYRLPPRPADLQKLAEWNSHMRNVKFAAPPPFLIDAHIQRGTRYYGNWSGYEVRGSTNQFTSVDAGFYQPSISASACSNTSVATWSGIGGTAVGNMLGQGGTERDVNQPAPYNRSYAYSWNEAVLKNSPYSSTTLKENDFLPPYPNQGDYVVTYTSWRASPPEFSGSVQDVTTGVIGSWVIDPGAHPSGESFEAVTERPTLPYPTNQTNLSNFGTMYYYSVSGNGKDLSTYSPSVNQYADWMTRTGLPPTSSNPVLAQPSALGITLPSGFRQASTFSVRQLHCN